MKKIKGQYQIESWEENVFRQLPDMQKATRAEIKQDFSVGLKGESNTVYLMSYINDDQAYFNGMSYFEGELKGKKGSFILIENGVYKDKIATCRWSIAPDSGTGELKGISGSGGYQSGHCMTVDFELEYELPTC